FSRDWSSDVCSSDLLGVAKNRIADLQKLPFTQLLAAQATAAVPFSPVIGTDALPHHPFDPVAPPESADVPIIIGTTLDDAALASSEERRAGRESRSR